MTINDNIKLKIVGLNVTILLITIVIIATSSLAVAIDSAALKHYNKGNTLSRSGNPDQAIEEYKKAITIDPNYSDAHYNLGNAYHNKARKINQIKNLSPEVDPVTGIPLQEYVKKWKFGREELILAIKEFKEVIRLQPNAADAYFKLGVVYDNYGDYKNAISAYNKAMDLNPRGLDGVDARTNLALIYYFVQGKKDEAIKELKTVLKINPNHPSAKKNLKKIQQR